MASRNRRDPREALARELERLEAGLPRMKQRAREQGRKRIGWLMTEIAKLDAQDDLYEGMDEPDEASERQAPIRPRRFEPSPEDQAAYAAMSAAGAFRPRRR